MWCVSCPQAGPPPCRWPSSRAAAVHSAVCPARPTPPPFGNSLAGWLLVAQRRGIFSFRSDGIQTIMSLRPLIAQVGEGKVTAPEGAAAESAGRGPCGPGCSCLPRGREPNRQPVSLHTLPLLVAVVPNSTVVCFGGAQGAGPSEGGQE